MTRVVALSLVLLSALLSPLRADQFVVEVKTTAGTEKQTAQTEVLTPGVTARPRALLRVKAGTPITIEWLVKNVDPKMTANDVLIHYFLVKQEQLGQKVPVKPTTGVVAESALTMDFRPQDQATGKSTLVLEKPGAYLLRLETIGVAGKSGDREFYAQLELEVR